MNLQQMEHNLNTAWASLSEPRMIANVMLIMAANPPESEDLVLTKSTDLPLIKMCLGYVAMKHLFERAETHEMENANEDG